MAKTIIEDAQLSGYSLRSWGRVIAYGAVIGLVYWLLALVISKFIVEPLVCRQLVDAAACVNAPVVAGKITTVLVAALSIAGMIRLGVVRPIIIAVASAAVLWEVPTYMQGLFWLEGALWTIVAYVLSYALFGWLARSAGAVIAVILSIVLVVGIRIALVV